MDFCRKMLLICGNLEIMMNYKKIKLLTIDLDETLWPVMPTLQFAEQALYEWLLIHAPQAALLSDNYLFISETRKQIIDKFPNQVLDLSFMRQELIRRLLEESSESEDLASSAFEIFYSARQKVNLFDDALPFLEYASARYPLVALSNGNADVNLVGLGKFFHSAVHAHQVGIAKPDVKLFLHVAKSFNLDPSEILHIGDDQVLDALGAINAGMNSVWLNRNLEEWKGPVKPTLTISRLTDLIFILEN